MARKRQQATRTSTAKAAGATRKSVSSTRKAASASTRKAAGSARKAASATRKTASAGTRTATRSTSKAASATRKTARAGTRTATRSSGRVAISAAVHAEPAQLDKESLVARLTGQLRKLKKEELVSLVERAEAGTLDFRHLTTSGEGGFGFQEALAGEERERSDGGER